MDSDKIISLLSGQFSPMKSEIDLREVEYFCTSIENFLSRQSFKDDFIYVKTQISISGLKHFRYQQIYKGIPVHGRFLNVHSNIYNQISSLSNDYQLIEGIPVIPNISPEIALNTAKQHIDDIVLQRSIPELIIYTFNYVPTLAYNIKLSSRYNSRNVVVDAISGEVINIFSLIYFDGPILGSGENLLGEWVDSLYVYEGVDFPSITGGLSTPNIYCEEYCWDYGDCDGQNYDDCVMSYQQGNCSDGYIEDCDGDCMIESFLSWNLDDGICDDPRIVVDMTSISTGNVNMVNTDNSDREPIFTLSSYGNYYTDIFYVNSETSVFDLNIGSSSHASGVSSHDYHTKTLEYFDSFGYLGMSGTGLRLANLIDYGPGSPWGINNAFYNAGNQTLNYGMGSGEYRPWCAGIDVVAHEFGHSFTEHTSGLIYQDQPGALNEHMSDAFGYLVEALYQDGGDWKMAEDITVNGNGIRNMQDPTIFGDPDHIESPYYFTGSADFGGVHTNSSVPNKVLYLVVDGDTHYGVEVNPFSEDALLSREIAGNIWFNWNAYYLAAYDGFFIAAGKMLQTATDLYPADSSIQQTVYDAWRSVGVDIFEPYLELNALTITEDNDGVINPGEDIDIEITLENVTSNIAENVTGELSCTEIEILDGDIFFQEILPMSISSEGDGSVSVQIPIDIVISDKECFLNILLHNQNDEVYEYEFQITVSVRLDQQGFPILTNQILSSPALADLDGDGVDEIVITDNEGTVTVLNYSGEEQCTFDTGNQVWGSPAIADLDNDGELEIIVSSKSRHLYILDGNCNVEMDYNADQYLMGSPALGDIDGDGELEIIVGGYSSPGKLFAVNPEGTDVTGFPIELGEKIQRGVALADFNGNGRVDIVCGTDGENIYLIYDDGTVADGFPFEADHDFRSAPSILDYNGEKIIFAGSRDDNFYALNSDGTLRFQVETGADIISTAGFTELNGMPAVFFGSSDGFLYGVDVNGNALSGFPIETEGDVNSSPVFAVLDSETNETVVISGNEGGDVLAYTLDGESVQYFPLSYEFPFKGAPIVKDTDGDGDLEILMGTSNSLVNVDVKTAGASDGFWNIHRGNLYRTGYYEFISSGGDMTITVSNMSDWNLMGLPVTVGDNDQMSVYPSSIEGTLFSFEDSYVQENLLNSGTGYWLRFEELGETNITGSAINSLTIQMQDDWNLISGISTPVEYTDIVDPEGIVIPGTLFGFGESYEQESVLEPGKAYWLRTTDFGEIHLGSNRGARVSEVHNPDNMNSITVKGMILYFGVEVDETEKLRYSLPPKPPAGAFDVRFKGNTRITTDKGEIEVMNAYETLTINYSVIIDTGDYMNWMLTSENGNDYLFEGTGWITVPSSERFTLELKAIMPAIFNLHQNFPNPFNPITTLRYDLPERAMVTLTIYDLMGRKVTQLVNTTKEAGYRSVKWDATDSYGNPVSAGVYIFQIYTSDPSLGSGHSIVQTRKMIILK